MHFHIVPSTVDRIPTVALIHSFDAGGIYLCFTLFYYLYLLKFINFIVFVTENKFLNTFTNSATYLFSTSLASALIFFI